MPCRTTPYRPCVEFEWAGEKAGLDLEIGVAEAFHGCLHIKAGRGRKLVMSSLFPSTVELCTVEFSFMRTHVVVVRELLVFS